MWLKHINDALEELQLIRKEVPVTEENPEKSRKGLYKIVDPFFNFWFKYIFPFKSENHHELLFLFLSFFKNLCKKIY